jgi:hypothetical protein
MPIIPQLLLLRPLVWEQGLRAPCAASASVGWFPTGGSLRVFKHFVWLEGGSVKAALSRPAHQRVTQAVSPPIEKE